MQTFILWRHHIVTFVIILAAHFVRGIPHPFSISYGLSLPSQIIVYVIVFAMAFDIGIKNAYLKWVYPISIAIFAYLIPPLIATYYHLSSITHHFLYYLAYGFLFIFLTHLTVAFLGLGLGVLVFKQCSKNTAKA